MHDLGVSNDSIKAMMEDYNKQIEELSDSLNDALIIITADHGMADIQMKCVDDYPHINNMLKRHISVEPRCCSFFIKENYLSEFPKIFNDTFGNKFILYTHDEFINSGLLGSGTPHFKTYDFVGDYIAVAVSDICLWYKDINGEYNDFKGGHAGLTEEELIVPLITIEKD